MKLLLCILVLAAGCKGDKKSSPSGSTSATDKSAPTSAGDRPSLPRGDLPGSNGVVVQGRDWNDPAVREEWEQKREERKKRMEEQLDTNHDGVVSPEEHAQRVKPMFDRMDQNGDGKLTPAEIAASDRRMGFDDPASLDTNKDGLIELQELDAAVTARRAQMRDKWRGRADMGVGSGE